MRNFLIHPAKFKLDGGAMFGIIPKPLWERKTTPDEQNRISLALRIWYLEIADHKVLVDTGIGDYHDDKFELNFGVENEKEALSGTLKKFLSVNPSDITDIVLTHLHFDHVGGLGTKDENGLPKIVFPNATIHLHQDHYNYALKPTMRDAGSFQSAQFKPLLDEYQRKNQLKFYKKDQAEILPGLNYKVSFGHTPHMIHPYTDKYIYMADLVPTSHHINLPWVMGYDINPGVTTDYKKEFFRFIQEKNLTMIFEHDIDYCHAELSLDEKKRFRASNPKDYTDTVLELF